MSALAELGLTADDVLAMMDAGERAAFQAQFDRDSVKDKSYLELPMGREVGRYLASKRKMLTPSSYIGYEGTLHKFALAFADLSLEDFENPRGPDLIEPWMDRKWGSGKPGTYNTCHAHLKDFFKWQILRDRMRSNPMDRISRARKIQPYRETFSQDEVRAIIASAGDLRDRIALRLLFYHGLRKGALQTIQFKHFDYGRRKLTVFTKGSKVQNIPLPEAAFWTDYERHVLEVEAKPDDFLMCVIKQVPYGSPDAFGRRRVREYRMADRMMTSTPLHMWWGDRIRDAGIPYRHMHCARHTFAQMILEETHDLKLAQELLGHASVQTTGDTYSAYDFSQQAVLLAGVLNRPQ